ncbi:MAG: hypothetical protein K0R18_1928 [Bacillales bacterium]|jgi:hypothetical protein|nr:hypothetical protein [Bacillales bacterium]
MLQESFPVEIRDDVLFVIKFLPRKSFLIRSIMISDEFTIYKLEDSILRIPYRIYLNEVSDKIINKLSFQQKEILYCIYTRSDNGYIREKYLKALMEEHFANWSIPFIVKLCDEYVVDILELVFNERKDKDNIRLKKFCEENMKSFCKSYSRMISYWNEFYRKDCLDFHKYVGRKLFRECFGYSRSMERENKSKKLLKHGEY